MPRQKTPAALMWWQYGCDIVMISPRVKGVGIAFRFSLFAIRQRRYAAIASVLRYRTSRNGVRFFLAERLCRRSFPTLSPAM